MTDDLPQLRDPDNLVYFRREGAGLVLGGYERDPAPWSVDGVPADFNNRLLPEDWDRFAPLMEAAARRVPAVEDADVVQLVNGPEGFTPDNEFVLGESEVAGFFVAAGFCAHGIAGAGGVGRVMAEWILDGEPGFDTWKMDIRRFGAAVPQPGPRGGPRRRGLRHLLRHPLPERGAAGRPAVAALAGVPGARRRWAARSARRAGGSGRTGSRRTRPAGDPARRPVGWAGEHWSPAIGAEALACRDAVALFDETSFSKVEVVGAGAAGVPEPGLCQRGRPAGRLGHLHPALNDRGGIECDLTATRLAADRYLLVTGTAFGNHDLALDPQAGGPPARGRGVHGAGRHLGLRLLRPLGAGRPRAAATR